MLKSSLVISPEDDEGVEAYEKSFYALLASTREFARTRNEPCHVLLQHSLRHDKMAVMVECGRLTISGVSDTFDKAIEIVVADLRAHLERGSHEELRTTTKPAARTKSCGRCRSKASKGQRSSSLRKGRRTQAR